MSNRIPNVLSSVLWSESDTDGSQVAKTLTVCKIFSSRNPLMAAQVVEEDLLIITFLFQVMDMHISTCKKKYLITLTKLAIFTTQGLLLADVTLVSDHGFL